MKRYVKQKKLRVFLAVELSLDLLRKVVELQCQLRDGLPKINWVPPESLHLTLKFLGYVDAPMVEQILTAIEPIRTSQQAFTLEVKGVGVFPHLRRPRILWVGCTGDIPALLTLVSRIEGALEPLGFPPEDKPFFPHLTLARINHNNTQVGGALTQSGFLEQSQALGILHIDRITLFRSEVSQSGAEYTALRTLPFNEPGSHISI
ncbi:MAG: RNA 2',3'-cyclic phosphodiesterase [Nitrospirales bacterium]|nr:MAG: RNA 2',3'-cyclic phosphodiesterase [Nitrospirales bacterium]